jgi:shikimate dehydrogenase
VIGSPIAHSKSPLLHLAAYEVLGLDWTYVRSEVVEAEFDSFIRGLDRSWRGLSVTMPLKTAAFEFASSHDAHALYTQAVNCLAFSHSAGTSSAHGYNTDVFGIASAVKAAGLARVDHATIIGGGATAASALVALDELGFQSATIAVRTPAKAGALEALGHRMGLDTRISNLAALSGVATSDLVVSTIPGAAEVSLSSLSRSSDAVLLDAAYDVWPSPRAQEWEAAGGRTVSGLSMLAYQAIKQVRIFVADSPGIPIANEDAVAQAMFASVGLNERGL